MKKLDSMISIGNLHVEHGIPCQDRAIAIKKDNSIILAVADGMGSYKHAEIGAEFAVNYIQNNGSSLEYTEPNIFRKELSEFMYRLQENIINFAIEKEILPDEIHSTLSFSIINKNNFINVSVGDSPLYTLTKDGPIFLDGNDNGSTRENNNSTYSIVDMENSIKAIGVQVGLTKNLRTILITSDGAIGWSKQQVLLNKDNFGDLPIWYYDMLNGKRTFKNSVKRLVKNGYDDVGIAYYVHDTSLITKQS